MNTKHERRLVCYLSTTCLLLYSLLQMFLLLTHSFCCALNMVLVIGRCSLVQVGDWQCAAIVQRLAVPSRSPLMRDKDDDQHSLHWPITFFDEGWCSTIVPFGYRTYAGPPTSQHDCPFNACATVVVVERKRERRSKGCCQGGG